MKTTLWHVFLTWLDGAPLVIVSDEDQAGYWSDHMRIRTISPNAAGRKYIRENLARREAIRDFETANPLSENYGNLTPEMVKSRQDYRKKARIKVVKSGKSRDVERAVKAKFRR